MIPKFPFESAATDLQRGAEGLHKEAVRLEKALAARQDEFRESVEDLEQLRGDLNAEIERGARSGRPNKQLEEKLAVSVAEASATAGTDFHSARIRGAQSALASALAAYEGFMQAHALDFLEELRPVAEEVAAEWRETREKALGAIEARHHEIQARAIELAAPLRRPDRNGIGHRIMVPFSSALVPTDYQVAPVPSPEALEP